ncbi:MAG TPA: GvpL/GvpF family gas vesicle protein, partial [Gemmatimonadaceae bacterium]|nr:GvpL/GvpF family gas vesicle protein [Gemmatimonadaceae bacterium]
MTPSPSVWYVYGIVPATASLGDAPAGIDDRSVTVEATGRVAALVSRLPADVYGGSSLEERVGDLEWLSGPAVIHDRVLSWASEAAPVIPLPLFSGIFSSVEAVAARLRDREGELAATLDRLAGAREYALRVYRVDAELRAALPTLSPSIDELTRAAESAGPGQRYLLERKLDERAREELTAVGRRVAAEVLDALAARARGGVASPIPRPTAPSPGTLILNAAFLVADDGLPAFQETL